MIVWLCVTRMCRSVGVYFFFFFKQEAGYGVDGCDWSSDVWSSGFFVLGVTVFRGAEEGI